MAKICLGTKLSLRIYSFNQVEQLKINKQLAKKANTLHSVTRRKKVISLRKKERVK